MLEKYIKNSSKSLFNFVYIGVHRAMEEKNTHRSIVMNLIPGLILKYIAQAEWMGECAVEIEMKKQGDLYTRAPL